MRNNNPFHNPSVVEKAMETKRKKGTLHRFAGKRGGNGKLSKPQKLLAEALQWPTEVAVSTGSRKTAKGYPTNYKIDIANAGLKVGIEIDGKGHTNKKIKDLDKKKENKLRMLGWTVLRFTNEEILEDLSIVLSRVGAAIGNKP